MDACKIELKSQFWFPTETKNRKVDAEFLKKNKLLLDFTQFQMETSH